jgi:hypothetical protein
VDAFHRGDDAELAEARNVGRAEVLRVLDPPAKLLAVFLRMSLERLFVDVQDLTVATIAWTAS